MTNSKKLKKKTARGNGKADTEARANGTAVVGASTIASPAKHVCVYCGSGPGNNPAYVEAARELGQCLAANDLGLVYGGGGLGLMGEVARATLNHGGYVTGIIPKFLTEHERMLANVNEQVVTNDMHERKMLMFDKADAFVALPGGIGTLEELVEQLTWAQLGQHRKPIVLANINAFWSPFLELLDHMRSEAFIRNGLEVNFTVVESAPAIVEAILGELDQPVDEATEQSVLSKF